MTTKPGADPLALDLDQRREAAGITAQALQKRAGVSSSTYWSWLNGGAEAKRSTLQRCEDALAAIMAENPAATDA